MLSPLSNLLFNGMFSVCTVFKGCDSNFDVNIFQILKVVINETTHSPRCVLNTYCSCFIVATFEI